MTPYCVWSPRGELYHDTAQGGSVKVYLPCIGREWGRFDPWHFSITKPPPNRRLCHRCEKLRAKKGAGG